MVRALGGTVRRSLGGVATAVRSRPLAFALVAGAALVLEVFLPPLIMSLTRKPVDFFTFNPWLRRLPEYVVDPQVPLEVKLQKLPQLALFWFSSDSPFGGIEWGFAVLLADLGRFVLMSLLVAAYAALLLHLRAAVSGGTAPLATAGPAGAFGALSTFLGFSTGACSVMGCGAPVIPVLGLAFVGLSSGTLALLGEISRIGTAVGLGALSLGVAWLGWLVGGRRAREAPGRR